MQNSPFSRQHERGWYRAKVKATGFLGNRLEVERAVTRAMKKTLRLIAEFWYRKRLPTYFHRGSAQKYGYTPRSENYNTRKRKKGIFECLVWSGDLRARLITEGKVSGTSNKSRVYMRIPAKKNWDKMLSRDLTKAQQQDEDSVREFAHGLSEKILSEEMAQIAEEKFTVG